MRVRLNSDVLFTNRLIRGRLPGHVERFARECVAVSARIVLPRTTLLEVEPRQRELTDQAVADLIRSQKLLAEFGVACGEVPTAASLSVPDVPQLFRAGNSIVEVVEPTLADYIDAERRAALHLAPLRPQSTMDEMRDLVIWAVACRIARNDGGAILVSRDEVHTGSHGDEEAAAVKLQRVKDFTAALELVGVESPPARLARSLLLHFWQDLVAHQIPLADRDTLRRISQTAFIQGVDALAEARFQFSARSAEGKDLEARVRLQAGDTGSTNIMISDVTLGGQPFEPSEVSFTVSRGFPTTTDDTSERLADLRQLLEDT